MLIIVTVIAMRCGATHAQNVTADKTLATIEAMPRSQAIAEMNNWLDATAKMGGKDYKKLIACLEEMLSEPTWETHNEALFRTLIEHASTRANCLTENEKMRPRLLLDVVQKNAPGEVANDIYYETFDGSHHQLSEIPSPYTLIYFNDPECLSCAKVKERLDTCTTLKNMVNDSLLTVVGIYPYENADEWRQESFPDFIINGWDYKQQVDGEQTYDLMTMPLFYILDNEKHVILKNEASLNRVLKVMNALNGLGDSNIEDKLNAIWSINR